MFPHACVGCGAEIPDLQYRADPWVKCRPCGITYKKHPGYGVEPVWVTKDNQWLPITEINTSHLRNIVGNLLLRPGWRESYRQIMIDELELRLEEEKADGPPT
jgi:hypothetical protein